MIRPMVSAQNRVPVVIGRHLLRCLRDCFDRSPVCNAGLTSTPSPTGGCLTQYIAFVWDSARNGLVCSHLERQKRKPPTALTPKRPSLAQAHLPQLSRLPQPTSRMASPSKIPLTEKSPNIFQQHIVSPCKSPAKSPAKSPDKRPSILGPAPPAPIFAIHEVEEPLTTSHLVGPLTLALPAMAPLGGGAKRKIAETGIKPPASKRMTLADRAAVPKQFAAKPGTTGMTRSVSANLSAKTPATRNGLSSTVGPGAARTPAARPIAAPRSRVVSAGGLSKSVGPTTRSRATPAPATQRPPSRGDSARPPSREGTTPASSAPSFKAKRPAWDTKGRLEDMELAYLELKEKLNGTTCEKDNMNDLLASERARRKVLSMAGFDFKYWN